MNHFKISKLLVKEIAGSFGIVAIYYCLIWTIIFFSYYLTPSSPFLAQHISPWHLLMQWDANYYYNIATQGYTTTTAFFPLYPILIWLFSFLFSPLNAGLFISYIFLSLTVWYIYRLFKHESDSQFSFKIIALLLLAPCGFFFASLYTESLFLFFLVTFFYYLKEKRWLIASLMGTGAVLTRNVGVFLIPVYITALYVSENSSPLLVFQKFKDLIFSFTRSISGLLRKKEFYYVLLIPLGLSIFCFYTLFTFHDFLKFIHDQKMWADVRTYMFPWQSIPRLIELYTSKSWEVNIYGFLVSGVFEFGSALLTLVATIYWIIKKQWPYAVLCLLNTLIFFSMFPMASVNRYMLVILPVFIFIIELTERRMWLFLTILAFSIVLFTLNLRLFVVGTWIG